MKLILDNCVHKQVKDFFPGHDVKTAFQAGLARLENGDLLAAAALAFDVLITTDKNIRSQHNLSRLPIPVIELAALDTRIDGLLPLAPFCPVALEQTKSYRFVRVRADGTIEALTPRTPVQ